VSDHETTSREIRGVTTVRPYRIRGRFLTAIALRLEGPADRAMLAELDAQLRQTPQFFADAPLVIDLEHAGGQVSPEDLQNLVEHLRFRKVSVFALQAGSREQKSAAAALGLIAIPPGGDAPPKGTGREEAPAPAASPEPARQPASRLVTAPVRSGQTIVAEKGDLTVVGPVGSGAELIAAGSIHVYGPLRGRASAGVFGDESARIFCQDLDAELLSVAGLYRTSESLGPEVRRRSVQVFLEGDRLCVEPLGPSQTTNRSGQ
jgi:septum site-determining protein MinC